MRRSRGFTLLEVMLAMGLLLGCVIVLAELASIGREHGNAAEDLTTAQLLCQNRLNEILAGATPLTPIDNEDLENDGWMCSVGVEPLQQPGLAELRVTVSRDAGPARRAREFTLVRWIPDPGISSEDSPDSTRGATSSSSTSPGATP